MWGLPFSSPMVAGTRGGATGRACSGADLPAEQTLDRFLTVADERPTYAPASGKIDPIASAAAGWLHRREAIQVRSGA